MKALEAQNRVRLSEKLPAGKLMKKIGIDKRKFEEWTRKLKPRKRMNLGREEMKFLSRKRMISIFLTKYLKTYLPLKNTIRPYRVTLLNVILILGVQVCYFTLILSINFLVIIYIWLLVIM